VSDYLTLTDEDDGKPDEGLRPDQISSENDARDGFTLVVARAHSTPTPPSVTIELAQQGEGQL